MSYARDLIEDTREALGWKTIEPEEMPLVLMYALLSRAKGTQTTAEDVHDAWALWAASGAERPDHWSLVPFSELDEERQEKDEPYAKALREV